MEKKIGKKLCFVILVINTLLLISLINAEASPWPAYNVCCEKTKTGAWCQNTLKENCDNSNNLRQTPTSCSATSFCKPGCCYESSDGLCMENTPQRVCNDANGTYINDAECNVPQCELGCCVLGNQAAFVTLTRCKRLSSIYGLETNFRKDIADESTCLAFAASQDQGACVYEVEFQRTCRFTTRGECLGLDKKGNITSGAEFFKDYLCSAGNLSTNCGKSTKTMCVEGKDEVYFKDTCGNPANIYDASKKDEPSYWTKVMDKNSSCGYGKDNANSASCGNCDYFRGSICSKGSASYGDYICKDLNCYDTQNGKDYKNGESWCIYDGKVGQGQDTVGSRHFRHVCINGEETIEPCADFRNEVCFEADIKAEAEVFIEAACRVNRWVDCIEQGSQEECENLDKRDCFWYEGVHFTGSGVGSTTAGQTFSGGVTGKAIFGLGGGDKTEEKQSSGAIQIGGGICLSDFPPGLKFWESGEAEIICSLGNTQCVVEYEKKLIGSKKCIKNCECLEESWKSKMNEVCIALGDCGDSYNFVGKKSGTTIGWKIDGKKATSVTGKIISEDNSESSSGIIQGWLNKMKGGKV